MKNLPLIKCGQYEVAASAEHAGDGAIDITVRCLGKELTRRLNHQGSHDHSEDQFQKDVNDFAARLAEELAGKIRSMELAGRFTKG